MHAISCMSQLKVSSAALSITGDGIRNMAHRWPHSYVQIALFFYNMYDLPRSHHFRLCQIVQCPPKRLQKL